MTLPYIQRATDRLRPAYRIYRWVWSGLDLVYPPHCGGCGEPGSRWCSICQQITQPVPVPVCKICGQPQTHDVLCDNCLISPPAYRMLRSWAIYEGAIREAVHSLKYNGDMSLGEVLAQPLIQLFCETGWKIDLVTPVPISANRRAERGYNQAALLAWPLALSCGLGYRPKALSKKRETRSQVGLNFEERHSNVIDAFHAESEIVKDKVVLVIDDVTTSGATMHACANALLVAGADQVFGLTLTRAVSPAHKSPSLNS